MCDYSLHSMRTRPAKVGDKLVTKDFGVGTRGFSDRADADMPPTAVCVLPGTEIAFEGPVEKLPASFFPFLPNRCYSEKATFRQIKRDDPHTHHDALEFENGDIVLLTMLQPGQYATVLQLPAAPKTPAEAEEQKRVEFVG